MCRYIGINLIKKNKYHHLICLFLGNCRGQDPSTVRPLSSRLRTVRLLGRPVFIGRTNFGRTDFGRTDHRRLDQAGPGLTLATTSFHF